MPLSRPNRRSMRCALPAVAALLAACVLLAPSANATVEPVTYGKSAAGSSGAARIASLSTEPTLIASTALSGSVSTSLYDQTKLFNGVTFTRVQLEVPSAGELQITLKDMNFPVGPSGVLSFALVDGAKVLGLINGTGALDFVVDGPGTLFGYVYGVADPAVNVASYYLGVMHITGGASVPLPAAGWLLLSGIALAWWVRGRGAALQAFPGEPART